ncbi:MAG: LSU ribosomal protein L31p @ LSU ribosomal protein L31p, zinc-independent [uncultured Thiotrichaceae bacterium]|uniref:Large ribosomal subunit protein bL31B n=1 Tax=uncultured Thiotrichaceae bacterium TaxID=298394 RepID=A0A6S6TXT9_9GAMM|nr:MAG: LSU ribosomal protein L31p @ LSU ribosomal protein L31p, zinc-independent [uncultured Thiotrichaceae bacterium]
MKPGIHPNYKEVVFQDLASGFTFLTRSTVNTKETIDFEGQEYPLVKVEISSQSHPFYTGKQSLNTTAGQIDKFNRRFSRG